MSPVEADADSVADPSAYYPFKLTSSFYGPGVVCCWYLVILSLIISWIFSAPRNRYKGDRLQLRLKVTSDFVGICIYPAIAAGDVLFQVIRCPVDRSEILMLASRLDFVNIPSTGDGHLQFLLAIAAPFKICACFLPAAAVVLIVSLATAPSGPLPGFNKRPAARIQSAALSVVILWILAVTITAGAATRNWYALPLLLVALSWPATAAYALLVNFALAWGALLSALMAYVQLPSTSIRRILATRDPVEVVRQLWTGLPHCGLSLIHVVTGFFCTVLFLVLISDWTRWFSVLRASFFPATGNSVGELDQAAGVIYGLASVSVAAFEALPRRRKTWSREKRLEDDVSLEGGCVNGMVYR